ncbi:DUF711 family protein [Infirmifilum lucidum]|uniref:DUF711 family protein n=1 Tax=Infirmifilum lucidum TaxID=2776706 RepID=A0A7L9FEB8_9CREN|nr:DUF711 family protein [Infirmifilum lucidum]QOJ78079.1 DUF711 family protein [Infirmifilum lucidum]
MSTIDIRAAALHIDAKTLSSTDGLERDLSKFLEGLDNFAESTHLKIVSKRVVAPLTSESELERTLKTLYERAESQGINYVGIPLGHWDPSTLYEALLTYPRLFLSVEYGPGSESDILKVFRVFSESSYMLATRFAVSFGQRVQTPYFPATQSKENGVSLSLLYVEQFKKGALLESLLERLKEMQRQAEASWDSFLGVDLSISPWMERSVASLVEEISGITFTLPGTIAAIRELNRRIEYLASHVKTTGFNEVMLPLAEDNRLKELARIGQLRFSHLLNYASYCVAGLDMVVIPDTSEDTVLLGLLRDLWDIHLLKRRPLGMRLILAPAEDGSDIDLGMFGKTPVLSPLR